MKLHIDLKIQLERCNVLLYTNIYSSTTKYTIMNCHLVPIMSYPVHHPYFLFIEGNPDSCKSFVINTMKNITKIIYETNNADISSAPTGCAAALIDDSTHYILCKIPVDRRTLKKSPNDIMMSQSISIQALKIFSVEV